MAHRAQHEMQYEERMHYKCGMATSPIGNKNA